MKPYSSPASPTMNSSKLKTIVQTFFLSHLHPISRALTKAKTLFIQVAKNIHVIHIIEFSMKKDKKKKKVFVGSFRMHSNRSFSHVMSSSPDKGGLSSDSSWNTLCSTEDSFDDDESYELDEDTKLSGYLHWLEQKSHGFIKEEDSCNEIDRLAEMFIAESHEKFRVEFEESYRRYQDMMARSV